MNDIEHVGGVELLRGRQVTGVAMLELHIVCAKLRCGGAGHFDPFVVEVEAMHNPAFLGEGEKQREQSEPASDINDQPRGREILTDLGKKSLPQDVEPNGNVGTHDY